MNTIECSCGCGEQIPSTNKRGEPARFKHGHNMKAERRPITPEQRTKLQGGRVQLWTDDETALLQQQYRELFIDQLAVLLPRHSQAAIFVKAGKLGLSKAGDPSLSKAEKISRALKGRIAKERSPSWRGGPKISTAEERSAARKRRYRARLDFYRAKYRKARALRRARELATTIGPINFDAIVVRDKLICGICYKAVALPDLSFDHIIPLSRGGTHEEFNIQVAHLRCNLKRGAGRLPAQIRLRI